MDLLFNLFPAQFSAEGSNRRDKEERAVTFWDTFNKKVKGTPQNVLHAQNSCSKHFSLNSQNIHLDETLTPHVADFDDVTNTTWLKQSGHISRRTGSCRYPGL